jgi:hypothetical protein
VVVDMGVATFAMDQNSAHTYVMGDAQILRAVLKHGGAIWIDASLIQDDVIGLLIWFGDQIGIL